jgi:hypothetical protein
MSMLQRLIAELLRPMIARSSAKRCAVAAGERSRAAIAIETRRSVEKGCFSKQNGASTTGAP